MRLFNILRNSRFNPESMGPVKKHLDNAKEVINRFPGPNHWICGGFRSAAIAAELLRSNKIIALPTDTIYGLAGLAQNDKSVKRLYEIKKRDPEKPLAICLWQAEDIQKWAHDEILPEGLIHTLLPGPTTIILKRKPTLNPLLNPGIDNVGIRVPKFDFTRSVVKMVNQPLALTSANESNKKSTLHPTEFEDLWPLLDGIFYDKLSIGYVRNSWRRGSTVVDLSVKGQFTIIRKGISSKKTRQTLLDFKLVEKYREKSPKTQVTDEKIEETESDDEESDVSKEKETCASS